MNRVLMRTANKQEVEGTDGILERGGSFRIGVLPGSRGAGATLVSLGLAQIISQCGRRGMDQVSYLEIRGEAFGPTVYDWIGIEKRFAGRSFHDFFQMAKENQPFRQLLNLDEGINWILPMPEQPGIETNYLGRLLRRVPGNILICDFSLFSHHREHLADMDVLILVVDPSPSGLLASLSIQKEIRRMEATGLPVIRVANRWNAGLEQREVLRFLQDRDLIRIPDIPYEHICRCQFGCVLPMKDPVMGNLMKPPLEKIIRRIFP